jgi:hypothetical protein
MSVGRRLAALLIMIIGQVSLAYADTIAISPMVDHLATPRARTDVLTYLAWLWVAIAVFIYILRLMIVEADRAHRLEKEEKE